MNSRLTTLITTLIISALFGLSASAYDFYVDGVYYNLDKTNNSAEVTYEHEYSNRYSGNIIIPISISVDGVAYSVKSIGELAFHGCKELTSISIPNSVTSIGSSAFINCTGLTSITIPSSVTKIGSSAFDSCTGLTSITIPNSVSSIEDGVFENCTGLSSITIPSSVTNIGNRAFLGCTYLISVIIPNSVTRIGESAFERCGYLPSINIPNSVTSIGRGAFCGCHELTSINIPNLVTNIEEYTFSGCVRLTSITIPNSVTSIGDMAFNSCTGLTSITIPNSVTSIGKEAFRACTGLTSIFIPNSVISIGDNAFEDCTELTSINIPNSVTSIGNNSFYGCTGLTSIIVPNSVTKIGDNAFRGCTHLSSITIPNSVTSIGKEPFNECKYIEIIFYDSPARINISSSIRELYLGDNITVVYNDFNCASLRKIVLGKSVTHIRPNAFYNAQLKEFTITGEEPPYCYPDVFGKQDLSKATLYVPESKAEYYQTTNPWSKFGKILSLNGDTPAEPGKCATPTISFVDGKLKYSCETDGVKYSSSIRSEDFNSFNTDEIALSACYEITVFATKEGCPNSDTATAKLYWLPSSGTLEGDNINNVAMRGIAIQSANGFINISGLDNNERVGFYGIDGKILGFATAIYGTTSFAAKPGSVVVAKIGNESVKIAVE